MFTAENCFQQQSGKNNFYINQSYIFLFYLGASLFLFFFEKLIFKNYLSFFINPMAHDNWNLVETLLLELSLLLPGKIFIHSTNYLFINPFIC